MKMECRIFALPNLDFVGSKRAHSKNTEKSSLKCLLNVLNDGMTLEGVVAYTLFLYAKPRNGLLDIESHYDLI